MESAPSEPPADATTPPADTPPELPPAADAESFLRQGRAYLTVNAPEDARVFVNGRATTTAGANRTYVSAGLASGRRYRYEVRAEVLRDGQTLHQTKYAELQVGSTAMLDFEFPADRSVETSLTVNVPDDAKVTLAGHETSATGTRRVFATSRLAPGETWSEYTVRVSVVRNGDELTREKTISLKAGESRELSFGFDENKIAAAR